MDFSQLQNINYRPKPFEFYTAADLWTNEHTAKQMLKYHLNKDIDVSSKNHKFIDKAVNWISAKFKLDKSSELIDFGCGPGLYSTRFAQKGIKTTGVDFSNNSIRYAEDTAKQNNLDIAYFCQNYLEFDTKCKFDIITMIMCDYCALSPKQRKVMLDKYRSILRPNGSVILDLYTYSMFDQKQEAASYELNQLDHFWSSNEYYAFINTFKYEKEKLTLDKYTIFEENNRNKTVYNWLQYFDQNSITKEFEESGLRIQEFYSDITGTPYTSESYEMAIVAQKI